MATADADLCRMPEEESPVSLRPLTEADAPIAYDWWRDPLVQGLLGAPLGPEDIYEFERFFADSYVRPGVDAVTAGIVERETGRLVGIVEARTDATGREAEFGIRIGDRDVWGKGYGTAAAKAFIDLAFETTDIEALYGLVGLTNERAKRALIAAGFRICCLMYEKEFLRVDLTREEWEGERARTALCTGPRRPG
jgi:RimJ/RimL family protein N-acetyltransferase